MRRLAPLLLALALTACSGSDGPEERLTLAPSTTTTTSPELAALAERLPNDVLDGFVPADDVLAAGPLDLPGAARASADPTAEERRLRMSGFVRGLSRAWVSTAGDTAYVAVYEFEDEAGAAAYDGEQRAEVEARSTATFEVEGGVGLTTVEGTGETRLTTRVALLRTGARWALVLLASEGDGRPLDDLRALAMSVRLG